MQKSFALINEAQLAVKIPEIEKLLSKCLLIIFNKVIFVKIAPPKFLLILLFLEFSHLIHRFKLGLNVG